MTAVITWGDGGPTSPGTVSYSGRTYTVSGAHTYAEEGSYPISIAVSDLGGSTATITGTATVADAPLSATGGFTVIAPQGTDSGSQTVATFTDPDGAETLGNYSATIDWGDHTTSTGHIAFSGGVFMVTGNHTYTGHGAFTITTTIHHETAPDATAVSRAAVTPPSSIAANFNGTAIQAGSYIWFSSVLTVSGLSTTAPTTILFVNQTITLGTLTLTAPNASITYHPGTGLSTTVFSGGMWHTDVYTGSGLSGNQFLSGLGFLVPSTLAGGIQNVTWSGYFFTNTQGVTLNWKWAAAVYTALPLTSGVIDYNALRVKPVDDTKTSSYQNSDHAGTLEGTLSGGATIKSKVIGGATGGGGSNFTGSYSGTKKVSPEFDLDLF
jgi:hypothetical protein